MSGMNPSPDLTRLLQAARTGRAEERDSLYAAVYGELRRIASGQRRRHAINSTLHTTAIVHESYLRLENQTSLLESDRSRFFGVAARAMRHILVDHYRARQTAKRGGDQERAPLEPEELMAETQGEMVLDLDEALDHLARRDERQAQVVELRFFVGLKDAEIAEMLNISDRTVRNEWNRAKVWLTDFLTSEKPADGQ